MLTFSFQLVFDIPGGIEGFDSFSNSLYEAGCADALFSSEYGQGFLDFYREAENVLDAVSSAVKDAESCGAKITDIRPEMVPGLYQKHEGEIIIVLGEVRTSEKRGNEVVLFQRFDLPKKTSPKRHLDKSWLSDFDFPENFSSTMAESLVTIPEGDLGPFSYDRPKRIPPEENAKLFANAEKLFEGDLGKEFPVIKEKPRNPSPIMARPVEEFWGFFSTAQGKYPIYMYLGTAPAQVLRVLTSFLGEYLEPLFEVSEEIPENLSLTEALVLWSLQRFGPGDSNQIYSRVRMDHALHGGLLENLVKKGYVKVEEKEGDLEEYRAQGEGDD